MKTLDEVIKALEICDETVTANCPDCPYDIDCENVPGEDLRVDALHYLKEYQGLSKMWNDKLDKEQENPPLTWDELRTMEGKPVWVETKQCGSRWYIIESIDEDMIIVVGKYCERVNYYRDDDFILWQAYRKERG